MPEISRFYGIVIGMYFAENEHNPPHIHAAYNEYNAVVDINTSAVIGGHLPSKAMNLVSEWVLVHRNELLEIWNTQVFKKIEPLE